jgi:hypothetical protein
MTSTTRTSTTDQPDQEEADRWRRALKARRRVKRGSSDRGGEPSPWQEAAIRAMEDAQPADAGEWA